MIWVKQAKKEHDAFVETMRERDVEVFYAEELLTDVLGHPRGARLGRRSGAGREARRAEASPAPAANGPQSASPAEVADYLIGGMTKDDLEGGAGLKYDASVSGDLLVPPLPNFMFQRDPVVMDLQRRHPQPDGQAGPAARDRVHGGDLPAPSDLRRRGLQDLVRRRRDRLGSAPRSRAAT